jgi:hypothetical protein
LRVTSRGLGDVYKRQMRTALYAAEKLGLQVSGEELKDPATKPDRLISKLTQVRDILGI